MIPAAQALASLSRVFTELQVPWVVVGSMASSIHGLVRTTQDVDAVVLIPPAKLSVVTAALQSDFFLDPELIRENFSLGRSANIFWRRDHFKVDLFPLTGDALQQAQLARATHEQIVLGDASLSIPVATAEDTLPAKLRWWRETGQSSRQWEDMRGIVQTSGPQLDLAYLRAWAGELHLADELDRLLRAADLPSSLI